MKLVYEGSPRRCGQGAGLQGGERERGSGGEYRYGVRCYAATAEKARLDAVRQFLALEAAIQEIKGTIHVKS